MKFSAVLAVAATVSAASLQKKQAQTYQIADFSGDCIPHSTQCMYSFSVISDPSLSPSHCSAFLAGPDNLPEVEDGECVDNVAYTWSLTKAASGGFEFEISYPFNSRSNITYCHAITPDQITTVNGTTANTQHYSGPRNFTASIDCTAN